MGRSQETFNKKEVRNKKAKKKKEKEARKLAKKDVEKSGDLNDMMAYLDEYGNITSTPPDPTKKKEEIDIESISISISKKEDEEDEGPRKGTVTFFNHDKGYGFIKDTATKESLFVHINNVIDGELNDNNAVIFDVEMGLKGPTAVNVKLDK